MHAEQRVLEMQLESREQPHNHSGAEHMWPGWSKAPFKPGTVDFKPDTWRKNWQLDGNCWPDIERWSGMSVSRGLLNQPSAILVSTHTAYEGITAIDEHPCCPGAAVPAVVRTQL
eukprot:357826-Chlamydomonas_euryale.AAC.8